jgi:hypothetical protein
MSILCATVDGRLITGFSASPHHGEVECPCRRQAEGISERLRVGAVPVSGTWRPGLGRIAVGAGRADDQAISTWTPLQSCDTEVLRHSIRYWLSSLEATLLDALDRARPDPVCRAVPCLSLDRTPSWDSRYLSRRIAVQGIHPQVVGDWLQRQSACPPSGSGRVDEIHPGSPS